MNTKHTNNGAQVAILFLTGLMFIGPYALLLGNVPAFTMLLTAAIFFGYAGRMVHNSLHARKRLRHYR